MVHMRVRHHDMRYGFAFQRRLDILDMFFDHRARIYDRNLAGPDNIGIGADMSEGARVLRNDAMDARDDLGSDAVFERHFLAERYFG